MELYAPGLLILNVVSGSLYIFGRADDVIVFGKTGDGVAMAHPHLRGGGDIEHERIELVDHSEHGTSVFTRGSALYFTTIFVGEKLGTVANTEQREFPLYAAQVGLGSVGIAHGGG